MTDTATTDRHTDETEADYVDRLVDGLLAEFSLPATPMVEFLGAQFDRGLAWVHFPEGRGGLGLSPKFQGRINERLSAAGAPNLFAQNPMGYGMCGPTILEWGSEDQKDRYLRRIITAEDIWCQLFSEPGAGSDVAGLATMAVQDGEEWVLNGQKVWTSLGHMARWGLIIARTDPTAVKHAGITAFVVDMHAPGVEVRPLKQMTGGAEFNEVYFTDVRVPASEMLGQPGEGWRVSITTLMNERTSIGGSVDPRGSGPIAVAVALAGAKGAELDAVARDDLTRLWIEAEVLRLNNLRAAANRRLGAPGPEGSTGKLFGAELNKKIYNFCMDLLGADGLLFEEYGIADRHDLATDEVSVARRLPAQPGEHDRGRDVGGAAQHPRRAGARSARRRPCRSGQALERGPSRLTRGVAHPTGVSSSARAGCGASRRRVSRRRGPRSCPRDSTGADTGPRRSREAPPCPRRSPRRTGPRRRTASRPPWRTTGIRRRRRRRRSAVACRGRASTGPAS
ncbi:MAG: acyl-CoA dehydrogenase family protein [Ilumatobacteraceae bacterium]